MLEQQLVARLASGDFVEPREVVVRVRKTRIDRERALVSLDRFRRSTQILDDNTEVEPVQREVRTGAQRAPIAALGGREITTIVVDPAEVIVGIREVRPGRDGPLVRDLRGRRVRPFEGHPALVVLDRGGGPAEPFSRSDTKTQQITHAPDPNDSV